MTGDLKAVKYYLLDRIAHADERIVIAEKYGCTDAWARVAQAKRALLQSILSDVQGGVAVRRGKAYEETVKDAREDERHDQG